MTLRTFLIALMLCGYVWAQQASQVETPPTSSTTPDSPKLIPITTVKPIYPVAAAQGQVQGEVRVKMSVDEQGNVTQVEAVSGPATLVPAALDAAKKWKFQPFIRDGRAVKVTSTVPFDFGLNEAGDVAATKKESSGTETNSSNARTKVRVSAGVARRNLIHAVPPVYPEEAKYRGISGTVVLAAMISREGTIESLHAVSGSPYLIVAATDAVRQWRYRPYLLNGSPVEVDTTINVNFTLGGR